MQHYLAVILMASLWVAGLQVAIQEGMILEKPHAFLEKLWPGNPILSCKWCMASIHTFLVLVLYNVGFEAWLPIKNFFILYFLAVPAVSVLGGSLTNLVFIIHHIYNAKESAAASLEIESDPDEFWHDDDEAVNMMKARWDREIDDNLKKRSN